MADFLRVPIALCATLWLAWAHAQPVYRCVDAAGRTSYQSEACAGGGRQSEVKIDVAPPAPVAPAKSMWTGYTPPKHAAITFYYDPKEEPVGFSSAQMESIIRTAAARWAAGCHVELRYGGKAPRRPGSPEHVSIYWEPEFMYKAHPSDPRAFMAGVGSMSNGIGLRPRFRETNMLSVMVHEMGHVLGLPHNHEDTQSVMSYLRDEATRSRAEPNANDLLACNLSMKKLFGIDFQPPPDAQPPEPGRKPMTDKEALERKYGPRKP